MAAETIIKKLFGWTLLIVSVFFILWGIWYSFEIFTAKRAVPEVFKFTAQDQNSVVNDDKLKINQNLSLQQKLQEQAQEKMQQLQDY